MTSNNIPWSVSLQSTFVTRKEIVIASSADDAAVNFFLNNPSAYWSVLTFTIFAERDGGDLVDKSSIDKKILWYFANNWFGEEEIENEAEELMKDLRKLGVSDRGIAVTMAKFAKFCAEHGQLVFQVVPAAEVV